MKQIFKTAGFALSLAFAIVGAASLSAQAEVQKGGGARHPSGGHASGVRPPPPPRGNPPSHPFHGATRQPQGTPRGMTGAGPKARPGGPGAPAAHRQAHDFRGRDFTHFSAGDRKIWRGGHWRRQWHNGINGWWWAVGGLWYFYPEPIYPYPAYVSDYVWEEPVAPDYPANYWLYCTTSGVYYPSITYCNVPWTPVAPVPAQ